MDISEKFLYFANGFVPYGATEKQRVNKLTEVGAGIGIILSFLTFAISSILGIILA